MTKLISDIIIQIILGFFATLGFVIYFNAPISSIFAGGLTGALAWLVAFILTEYFGQKVLGTFLGSFLVGVLGEYFAIKLEKPATVFIIPGIISMVPGAGTYYTMLSLIQKDFYRAASHGVETLFVAAAIAIGIIFSSLLVNYIKNLINI